MGNIDVAYFNYDDEASSKIRTIGVKLEFPQVNELKSAAGNVKNKAILQPPKLR